MNARGIPVCPLHIKYSLCCSISVPVGGGVPHTDLAGIPLPQLDGGTPSPPPKPVGWGTPPPCEQTDTCQIITFPLTMYAGGKNGQPRQTEMFGQWSEEETRKGKASACFAEGFLIAVVSLVNYVFLRRSFYLL